MSTYIGTDNYAAGQMAAKAALDGVDRSLRAGIGTPDEAGNVLSPDVFQ